LGLQRGALVEAGAGDLRNVREEFLSNCPYFRVGLLFHEKALVFCNVSLSFVITGWVEPNEPGVRSDYHNGAIANFSNLLLRYYGQKKLGC